MAKVSIVIPCFNQGIYLQDSLSGYEPSDELYEVIIVNDGSTETATLAALDEYKAKGYNIINQQNEGLAAARNTGIKNSTGQYIMLLDADNMVLPDFMKEAASILDNSASTAVVYSDAEYFGAKTGKWEVGPFNLQKIMIENYIDACAMVRKSVFEELGGYDTEMKKIKSGWEDWEMWLRIAFAGKTFHYRPGVGFRYRVNTSSMIGGITSSYQVRNGLNDYLHKKYPGKLGHDYITAFVVRRFKPHPFKFLIKLSMLSWFRKKYQALVDKNRVIRGI